MAVESSKRNVALVAVIALLLVVCAGLAHGIKLDPTPPSPLERTLAELQATPLLGLAMKDYPKAAAKVRSALQEDLRDPLAPGVPSRVSYALGELSRDYIRPILAAADDASVEAVLSARFALAHHMRDVDPDGCRVFAMNGIQRADHLDGESQKLFKAFVESMVAAYNSGRSGGGKQKPVASTAQLMAMLNQTGFTQADLDDLNRFAALPAQRACDIDLKIDGAPPNLPPSQRAAFARYVLTH